MTELKFLHSDPSHPAWRSPLARALRHAPSDIRDLSAEARDGPLGPAAGIAAIEVKSGLVRTLLARLSDLDAPGLGVVAGVRAQVTVEAPDVYRIWFPQEYSDAMARAVIDAWEGLHEPS